MTRAVLSEEQRAREGSVLLAIVLDLSIAATFILVSVVGGSFTLLAETIRGMLGLVPEVFTYGVIRRIHRGSLRDLDYGTGKIEQVISAAIGFSMLFAAVWIVMGGVSILAGERELGTPFGLACAAVAGMINLYINLVAWDSVRRVVRVGDSTMMRAQLTVRWTKMLASVIIAADLTVAAVSTDPVVVALADGLGAFIVAAYMTTIAYQGLRDVLPDLLEFSASQSVRLGVAASLARHSGEFVEPLRVRTRRSSQAPVVEITLAFDDTLSMAEVNRRIDALKQTVREEIGDAEVSVLAAAASR